jgi:hypothetical protein
MLKFYFNPKAMEALAKELRRASWGAAVASAAIGYHVGDGLSALYGASAWIVLQVFAFVLESLKDDVGGKK